MIVKGLENINKLDDLEILIVKICTNRYVDIEFDESYEPEIKLKIIYDNLFQKSVNSNLNENICSFSQVQLVDNFYSILRRYDVSQINYTLFYHLILAIELIRPSDQNNIIRSLIQEAKFIHLSSIEDEFNLHLKLIDVYLKNISDTENIFFVGNYLQDEFAKDRLNKYPIFFTILLRYYINFGNKNEFFWVLESIITKIDSDDKFFQVVLAIDEYTRFKKSYSDFYTWMKIDMKKSFKKLDKKISLAFLKHIVDWANRKKNIDKSKYIDLILIQAKLILENHSLEAVLPDIENFCIGEWSNKFLLFALGKEFCGLLVELTELGFMVVSDIINSDNIFIYFDDNKEAIFSSTHKSLKIKIPQSLYQQYISNFKRELLPTDFLNN